MGATRRIHECYAMETTVFDAKGMKYAVQQCYLFSHTKENRQEPMSVHKGARPRCIKSGCTIRSSRISLSQMVKKLCQATRILSGYEAVLGGWNDRGRWSRSRAKGRILRWATEMAKKRRLDPTLGHSDGQRESVRFCAGRWE